MHVSDNSMCTVSGGVHCSTSCKHVYVGEALKKRVLTGHEWSYEHIGG